MTSAQGRDQGRERGAARGQEGDEARLEERRGRGARAARGRAERVLAVVRDGSCVFFSTAPPRAPPARPRRRDRVLCFLS